jgi:hypothetical protein
MAQRLLEMLARYMLLVASSQRMVFSKTGRSVFAKYPIWFLQVLLAFLILMIDTDASVAATWYCGPDINSFSNAVIHEASAGDTVYVTNGIATWTQGLAFANDVQIIGQSGEYGTNTEIIDGGSPNAIAPLIAWSTSSNQFDRLSGIYFTGNTSQNVQDGAGTIQIYGTCKALRIDHCSFINCESRGIMFSGWIYGCVDDCYIIESGASAFMFEEPTWGNNSQGYGDGSWADADYWGTTNNIYVENCFISDPNNNGSAGAGGVADAEAGGRFVFRDNVCSNACLGTHGSESGGGTVRSFRLCEVYNNTFYWSTNLPAMPNGIMYFRGGTGVVFSNTLIGAIEYPAVMQDYRNLPYNFNTWSNISGTCLWDTNEPTVYVSGTFASVNNVDSSTVLSYGADSAQNMTPFQYSGNGITNYYLYDKNDQCGFPIISNSATAFYFTEYNVYGIPSYETVAVGDQYEVRWTLAAIDQPGRGAGDLLTNSTGTRIDYVTGAQNWPNEVSDPVYVWGNTNNWLLPADWYPHNNWAAVGYESPNIVSNRDWIGGIPRPGYTPLVYPHPLDTTNTASSGSSFTLTVNGGTGSGNYASNTVVSISANQTSNENFDYWIGAGINNTNQANTTVTMPNSNLTLTAYYLPYPPTALTTNSVP